MIVQKLKLKARWRYRFALIAVLLIVFSGVMTTKYAARLYDHSQNKAPNSPALQTAKDGSQEVSKAALKKNGQPDKTSDKNSTPPPAGQTANQAPTAPATAQQKPAPTPAPTPTPAPAPTPTPPPAQPSEIASESVCPGQYSSANAAVVLACMASYARAYYGIAPLNNNTALVESATAKAQDMLDCGYSHTACGRAFDYWFSIKGYTGGWRGENIASGQANNGWVFSDWMNSPGHRANILNPNFQDIGAAVSSSGSLWVMQLGGH